MQSEPFSWLSSDSHTQMGRLKPLVANPEDVLAFLEPTPALLDPGDGGFRLASFEIRDGVSSALLGSVAVDGVSQRQGRSAQRVMLSSDYLRCRVISSRIQFQVGEAIASLRMIERHFLQGRLIRTFDTTLGYCMPESLNTHEATLPRVPARH